MMLGRWRHGGTENNMRLMAAEADKFVEALILILSAHFKTV